MPSIYDLKPKFQALLRPLIKSLAGLGCTPNLVTAAALLLSIAIGGILFAAADGIIEGRIPRLVLLVLPVWLFLRMALNAIDGMMARELNMKSTLGAVLNEAGDVVSDLALYLPLARLHAPSLWPVVAFAFGAVLTEFCGLLTQALGAARHYEGPMGKSDRAFFIGALALVTAFLPRAFNLWPALFLVATAATALTCWNRLSRGLAELRQR